MAPYVKPYLQLRKSFGLILHGAELTLYTFDQYLRTHFPKTKTVTRSMVVSYLQSFPHLRSSSLHYHLTHLRQFCRFLFQLNPHTYIPERGLLPPAVPLRQPHLYTDQEVTELIRLAALLPPPGSLRPRTYVTLISLLWVTGLRIGEALRLNLEDVDIEGAVLHIRQSKFFKSRLVPISLSTASALKKYKEDRAEYNHDQMPTAPFFVNERGRRCTHCTVFHTFLSMVRTLHIKTAQGLAPRLHDFRHTFATRYLRKIYQANRDPNASLPLLATYMGHTNITYTQVYLHPSIQLLETAGQRFFKHVSLKEHPITGGEDTHERNKTVTPIYPNVLPRLPKDPSRDEPQYHQNLPRHHKTLSYVSGKSYR